MPFMLWPCVARMRKCEGLVSARAVVERAFWVDVSSFGVGIIGVDVAAPAVGVSGVDSDGRCNRAKRFLSDSETAVKISGKVTFSDLSFRQESCSVVSSLVSPNAWVTVNATHHVRYIRIPLRIQL